MALLGPSPLALSRCRPCQARTASSGPVPSCVPSRRAPWRSPSTAPRARPMHPAVRSSGPPATSGTSRRPDRWSRLAQPLLSGHAARTPPEACRRRCPDIGAIVSQATPSSRRRAAGPARRVHRPNKKGEHRSWRSVPAAGRPRQSLHGPRGRHRAGPPVPPGSTCPSESGSACGALDPVSRRRKSPFIRDPRNPDGVGTHLRATVECRAVADRGIARRAPAHVAPERIEWGLIYLSTQ